MVGALTSSVSATVRHVWKSTICRKSSEPAKLQAGSAPPSLLLPEEPDEPASTWLQSTMASLRATATASARPTAPRSPPHL